MLDFFQNKKMNRKTAGHLAFVFVVGLLIMGHLFAYAVINFYGFPTLAHPDMYLDTLVARYMWEQKTIFPENWVFGNQFYVIATPVLAALFYGITGSMNTSMALATTAMTFLLFLFLYLALRPYLPFRYCLLGVLTLLASNIAIDLWFNWEAQLLFALASYYACYMITVFVVLGDYGKSLTHGNERRLFYLLLSALLCFCTGMQSIRQTAIMIVPIASFEFLRIAYAYVGKKTKFDRIFFQPTLRVGVYSVSNILGVIFIKLLKVPSHSIYGSMGIATPDKWEKHLNDALIAIGEIIGYLKIPNHENGWGIGLLAAFSVICTLAALVKILRSKEWIGIECYILICLLSMAELFVGSIFFDFYTRGIYFFLWFPAMALSQVYLAVTLKGKYKKLFIALLLCVCAGNLVYSHQPNLRQINEKYATDKFDPNAEVKACKWLCKNGYEYVYGSYYAITPIAAESDGKLIGGYWVDDIFVGLGYVNSPDIYAPENNEKAAYYIHDVDLAKAMEYAEPYGGLDCLVHFGFSGLYSSEVPLMVQPEPISK